MPISITNSNEIKSIILKYIDEDKAKEMLGELSAVKSNKSYAKSIQLLKEALCRM